MLFLVVGQSPNWRRVWNGRRGVDPLGPPADLGGRKTIRGDDAYWRTPEDDFQSRSQITFTHGICADRYGEQTSAKRPVAPRV